VQREYRNDTRTNQHAAVHRLGWMLAGPNRSREKSADRRQAFQINNCLDIE
jgi:hypothetical protein